MRSFLALRLWFRTYGLSGAFVSISMVVEPLAGVWGGRGEPLWDTEGLEVELPGSEVSGDEALLSFPGVGLGEEGVGELVEDGETTAGGVVAVEGEEARRSGRFWLDERRLLRPSCSLAAIFLLSLRRWGEESSISPSSYRRAVCAHTQTVRNLRLLLSP